MVAQTRATVGGLASGTGNITPALPSGWQPDDILVLFVETANEAVSTPAGWSVPANSPVSQTNADVTRLSVFWRRAVGGDGNPTITAPGNHAGARMVAVSGCVTSGDPWEATAGAPDNASTTTADIPTGTTTEKNGLVVVGVATGIGGAANSAHHSAWTNAGLMQGPAGPAGMVERFDSRYTAGNGGSIGCATGQKLDAGAVGTTTSTMAAADTKACWSGVLKSAATPIEYMTAAVSTTDATSYNTASVAARPNGHVVVFAAVSGPAADPTCSGMGLTWIRQKIVSVSSGANATKLAYFTAPTGGSPSTGAITITSSGNTGGNWSVYQLNGANATTPIVQDPSTFTTTTPANVTLTFAAAADAVNRQVVAAVVTPQNTGNAITPEAGWTEDAEVVRSTPALKLWTARQLTSFDTSITITDDSTYDFAVIGLEVNLVTAADATATPGVIATTVALSRAEVNASAGPAVTATTTTLPAAGLNVAAGTAATGTLVAVPQPAVNVSAGPAVLASVVALPAPTAGQAGSDATATPDVIPATALIPAAELNVGAGPATVAAVAALPAAVLSGTAVATPAATATTSVVARPDVNVGTGPATVAAVAALTRPAVDVGAGPSTVPTVADLARPAVNGGAGPAVLVALATLPQASVIAGGNATTAPDVIATTVTLPESTPSAEAFTAPATAAAVADLMRAAVNIGAGPGPSGVVVAFPQAVPLAGGNATVTPATVAVLVALPQAGVDTGSTVTPATIAAVTALTQASVGTSAGPGIIAAVVATPQATVTIAGVVSPASILTLVALAAAGLNIGAGPSVIALAVTLPAANGTGVSRDLTYTAGPAQLTYTASAPRSGYAGSGPRARMSPSPPRRGGATVWGWGDHGWGQGPWGG